MTIITDHDLAVFNCQAYGYPEYGTPEWSHAGESDGVKWFAKLLPDQSVLLVLPGTDVEHLEDVFCDLDQIPEACDFLAMGRISSGFDHGLPSLLSDLVSIYTLATVTSFGADLRITGHSLGAARGNLIHERLVSMRFNVEIDPVLFGEPRSTELVPLEAFSYINGADPIHGLPPYPYSGRPAYKKLSVRPPAGHRWGSLLGWHDMKLYEQGLRA